MRLLDRVRDWWWYVQHDTFTLVASIIALIVLGWAGYMVAWELGLIRKWI
jgi:hypothetical protein